ncbi:MAG: Fic family protein [Acidobacteriota bacterium]|nr:Fic family protein [Acidobacteriota bacterium]
MTYIYQQPDWPHFTWDAKGLARRLVAAHDQQGHLLGQMEALGFHLRAEATLHSLTEEIIKSNEIEGRLLDREQVRSSIARRLGIAAVALARPDRDVEGVVDMMLNATQQYMKPLSAGRLFDWHAALFPTGRSGMHKITVGGWRTDKTGPMQVVSGPIGHQRVRYEAPPATALASEMRAFLAWFNKYDGTDLILRAGIAHLWFVTIHPFDDGNGRIARAIADMALARSEKTPQRFYSLSAQIQEERSAYYNILEETQKGDLDITLWLDWFLGCLGRALAGAETILSSVLAKARFWERHAGMPFNERQKVVINRLLDGFDGKLTSSKWAKLAKCSQDTAGRDIDDLLTRGILTKNAAGGRSTSYSLFVGAA